MTNNIKDIPALLKKFKHQSENYVKFHEIDSFQVVHNAQYLLWCEIARVEYCNLLEISILPDKFKEKKSENSADFYPNIYLVHSEINYFSPAIFLDKYVIYTRVAKLGFSSVTFESIIVKADKTPLCINQAVEVYVDKNMKPTKINNEICQKIIDFEKDDLELSNSRVTV
jgi:YbgC/YbaW family acyl-CoA thioester hydrolase